MFGQSLNPPIEQGVKSPSRLNITSNTGWKLQGYYLGRSGRRLKPGWIAHEPSAVHLELGEDKKTILHGPQGNATKSP